jgi:manganese/zinc/iron transport system permease protein
VLPEQEIQWIAALTAAACALPGVFLVLRRMALMSDAISHSILLGIVLAFFVVHDLSSPLLVAAAAATGVLTVSLVELLNRTRLVREDAAIALVFPALFSVGVILISRYAGNVHLDVDAVLLGELAFAPFNRWEAGGVDLGPRALWLMGAVLLLNLGFVAAFYKELKLTTFDAALAGALGFAPGVVHYLFMTLVSVTAVGAFEAVGSILVVALMIAPPAAAYLLTDRLPRMIALSVAIGVGSALSGYWASYLLDVSIAGAMASMTGVAFLAAFFLAPERGLLALARRRRRQRWEFAQAMLAIHLANHEGAADAAEESREAHLGEHLRWPRDFAHGVVRRAEARGLLVRRGERLALTDRGRRVALVSVGVAALENGQAPRPFHAEDAEGN